MIKIKSINSNQLYIAQNAEVSLKLAGNTALVTFTVGKNKKKYNVLSEQSVHGVNIVRTSIWAKMSYEEKLEYEYCMALKQKLSMNNKLYTACYGLINSIPFLPKMNNLTYSLLMDKKDPKVYADSPEGRLKNADIPPGTKVMIIRPE